MATTNRERVGKGLEHPGQVLALFVERELRAALGTKWQDALADGPPLLNDPRYDCFPNSSRSSSLERSEKPRGTGLPRRW